MGDVVDDTLAILRECQLDDPAVRDFLETVIDVYPRAEDDSGPPFEVFRRLMLYARDEKDTFRRAVDPFLEYAESNGGIDVARRLAIEDIDALIRWYGEVPEDAGYDEEYDENEWLAFLAEYTEQSGWTGDEERWPGYRDYLLYYAEERGFATPTERLLDEAENVPDKVAFLESYGVAVALSEDEAEAVYDPAEWNAFLVEYTKLSAWAGDEENWPGYRDWMLYYAEERGFTRPTTDFMEAAGDATDKAAFFEQYGITLGFSEEELEEWYPFLEEHGPEWDGDESTWRRFRRSFLEAAAPRGLAETATVFLDHVEGEPDKIAAFAEYGIVIGDTGQAAADAESEDIEDWYAFLAEYGPGWNGQEETWQQFREWFLHYAAERGVGNRATGFIEYAEGEPDKIAFFAQNNIDITAAGPGETAEAAEPSGPAPAPAVSEEAIATAIQTAELVVSMSPTVGPEHAQLVSDSFAELLTEVPEAAGLSPAQIRQLIEEVAAEHL